MPAVRYQSYSSAGGAHNSGSVGGGRSEGGSLPVSSGKQGTTLPTLRSSSATSSSSLAAAVTDSAWQNRSDECSCAVPREPSRNSTGTSSR